MNGILGTAVVQVTNLSASVSSEQMRTLFGFLGDIEELRLYPPDNGPVSFSSKVCYIKYRDPSSVGVAQHLTNTVFVDRALIVVPCAEGECNRFHFKIMSVLSCLFIYGLFPLESNRLVFWLNSGLFPPFYYSLAKHLARCAVRILSTFCPKYLRQVAGLYPRNKTLAR